MNQCNVIISHEHTHAEQLTGRTAIVIDTLRATTVMITALEAGARSIRCVAEPEDALTLKARDPELILGGERHALKIPGFDLSNSPLDYTRETIGGRDLVMTTSNGTRALLKSGAAQTVLIGCLRNARAVIRHALSLERDIILINAGTGGRFTLDDFITAGAMIREIDGEAVLSDEALAARLLYEAHPDIHSALTESLHYRRLSGLGMDEDLAFCLKTDQTDLIGTMNDGIITRL